MNCKIRCAGNSSAKNLYGVMSPGFVLESSPVFVHESLQNKFLNALPAQVVKPFHLLSFP